LYGKTIAGTITNTATGIRIRSDSLSPVLVFSFLCLCVKKSTIKAVRSIRTAQIAGNVSIIIRQMIRSGRHAARTIHNECLFETAHAITLEIIKARNIKNKVAVSVSGFPRSNDILSSLPNLANSELILSIAMLKPAMTDRRQI
jgi:hypothetical protein